MNDAPLTIDPFVEPRFGENAFVVSTVDAAGAPIGWVIDPSFPPQVDRLLEHLAGRAVTVEKILLTHGHADHIAGIDAVRAAFPDAAVMLGAPDQPMLADANRNLSAPFGLSVTLQARADADLAPGMPLWLGPFRWQVLDTSGHSPGSRSLYCPGAGLVIVGDALFAASIGRTDFPGSDHRRLLTNIRDHLFTLPDETVVYCGHGPTTTIGNERKSNPFLTDSYQRGV